MVKVGPMDKNSKRMKVMKKPASNVSNTTGFDNIEEQKNQKEIKTEIFDFDFDIKSEPIDEEMEKQALNVSNIMGFDYENQTIDKESKIKQEIKQEVKIEPTGDNFNE